MSVNTTKMDALKAHRGFPYNLYYMKDYTQEQKESLYWAIIEAYDWSANCNENIEQVQRHMLKRFDSGILIHASEFARERQSGLYRRVEYCEKRDDVRYGDYSGDDSFGDMLSHVVSMGEEFNLEVLKNPKILNGFKFQECFSYVLIDSDEDVQKFEVYYHRNQAYKLWAKLNYHRDQFESENMTCWATLAVMFDEILEAIGDQVEGEEDMDKLWATVGVMRDNKEKYRELSAFGYEYPNILKDMAECLFDWDDIGEVQLELL